MTLAVGGTLNTNTTTTNLLVVFVKVSRNRHHLLFEVNISHSHINQILKHSITHSVDPDQPASSEAG